MVIFLLAFSLIVVIVTIVSILEEDKVAGVFAGIISTIVVGIFLTLFLSGSYSSYLSARSFYDATIEQYSSAVTIYNDYAEINISDAAWTDFKYSGYQENMAAFVKDLRERITKYNECIIEKRIMDRNPIFSWMVIAPDDDMKVIKMKTVMKEAKETK